VNLRAEALAFWRKALWSWDGLSAAFRSEKAIRQELAVLVASVVLTFIVPVSPAERILLIALPMLLLATELLNTALEEVIDFVCPEQHPMAKKAKDCGSAAVALVACALGIAWLIVLIS